MTDRLQRLCDEIRALDPEEQVHILHLLGDLGAMPEPAIEQTWMLEARRRARAIAEEAQEEAGPSTSREAVNALIKKR